MFNDFRSRDEARFLKKLLALYVLYKAFYWLLNYNLLFSDFSIVYRSSVDLTWWRQPIFWLYNSDSSALTKAFILISVICSIVVLLTNRYSRVLFLLLWFAVSNINNKVFCTLSGGDYLLQHFLFFVIFLQGNEFTGIRQELNKVLHNTGVIALKLQLCFVYGMAGFTKLLDVDWMDGTAIADVFKMDDFSLPFMNTMEGNWLTLALNYTVVFYQLLFPILVWIKGIQKWYLLIGVMQHLFIAFIIGLPSFGFVMVIAYAIFHKPGLKK